MARGEEHEDDAEDIPPRGIDVDHVLETNLLAISKRYQQAVDIIGVGVYNDAHCASQTNEFEETDSGGGVRGGDVCERGRGVWCERLRESNRMSFSSCPMIAGGDGEPDMR